MNQTFPKYTTAATERLLEDLKKGSYQARDQLARRNARLVLKIAHKFIPSYFELQDELEDVAMRNLIERLESIRSGNTILRDSNLGAFLNKTTVFRLKDFIEKERKDLKRKILIIDHFKKIGSTAVMNEAVFNLLKEEILNSEKFTDREKKFIEMKLNGFLDVEIAEELQLSKSSMTWLKKNLEPKIKEFL